MSRIVISKLFILILCCTVILTFKYYFNQYSLLRIKKHSEDGLTLDTRTRASHRFLSLDKCACYRKTRGKRNQKIISYSYYLQSSISVTSRYGTNFESILVQAKLLYQNWTVRIYTNVTRLPVSICNLCKSNRKIWKWVWVEGSLASRGNGAFWRFFPLGDENVDIFISRDLDSPLSLRERLAVLEWENSNKVLHLMRDHPLHNVPMLAGLWGFKNHLVKPKLKKLLQNILVQKSLEDSRKGHDQFILESELLSRFTPSEIMSHDSYSCEENMKYGQSRPFLLQRVRNEFVGDYTIMKSAELTKPCPLNCRPYYGMNWTFC